VHKNQLLYSMLYLYYKHTALAHTLQPTGPGQAEVIACIQ